MPSTWARRAISLSVLAVGVAVVAPVVLVLLPLIALSDLVRGSRFAVTRAALFLVAFACMELVGVSGAVALWLSKPMWSRERWASAHYALQRVWARTLLRLFVGLHGMTIRLSGDALGTGPVLLLPRHASTADTVLPFLLPGAWRPRYVLKQELMWDPCLDIVGHRIPNAFVARGGRRVSQDLAAVGSLGEGLSPGDMVVLYPEGTRFTQQRRTSLLKKFRARGDDARAAEVLSLTYVLPARSAGATAVLQAAEGLDVVLLAHIGLDAVRGPSDVWTGGLIGAEVVLHMKRIPAADVPRDHAVQEAWLRYQWRRMDAMVGELLDTGAVAPEVQEAAAKAL